MDIFRRRPAFLFALFVYSLWGTPFFIYHAHSDRLSEEGSYERVLNLPRTPDYSQHSSSSQIEDCDEHHIHFLFGAQDGAVRSYFSSGTELKIPTDFTIAAAFLPPVLLQSNPAPVPFSAGIPFRDFLPLFSGLSPPQV